MRQILVLLLILTVSAQSISVFVLLGRIIDRLESIEQEIDKLIKNLEQR